jgi:penicillin-binding protein 1A
VTAVWVGYDQPRTIVSGGYATELTVPLWARFMMAATRGDRGEPFRVPSTVTGVEVCRVTGRLATDACRQAPDGMVYTEYFASGTQPLDVCLRHRSDLLRALFRSFGRPAAPARASVSEAHARAEAAHETGAGPAKKKRGFWSRVFGIGRGGDRQDGKQ